MSQQAGRLLKARTKDMASCSGGNAIQCCVMRQGVISVLQGLIISSQDSSKKEEAYDLAKKGIKNNLKSHVTWHVFG